MAFPIKVRFVLFNEPVSTDPFICIPFFILSISFDRIRSQFGHRMGFTHFPYNIHAYPKCHVQYSTIFLLYRLDFFFQSRQKDHFLFSSHWEYQPFSTVVALFFFICSQLSLAQNTTTKKRFLYRNAKPIHFERMIVEIKEAFVKRCCPTMLIGNQQGFRLYRIIQTKYHWENENEWGTAEKEE